MKLPLCSALLLFSASAFAQQLQLVSGNGMLVNEQFTSTSRMVVRAVDAAGQPLAGVPVTWRVTAGQGTIHTPTTVTDSEGLASAGFLATSIQPGTSFARTDVAASTPTSSVSFIVTTYQGGFGSGQPLVATQASGPLSGPAGSTIRDAFRIQVAASAGIQQGSGIPNVGIRVVPSPSANPVTGPGAQCEGPGGVVLTDQSGIAVCHLVLNGNPGTFSFTLRAGEILPAGGERAVTITQPEACNTVLTPSTQSFGAQGGAGTVSVNASSTCVWTPVSNASWITLASTGSVTGSGQLSYTVGANPSTAPRTGTIAIAGATLTIVQAPLGSSSSLTFQPNLSLPSATRGTNYAASLSAVGGQPPYTFSATGLPPGLTLTSGSGLISGSATAAGTYNVAATVRDVAGATASQTFQLQVTEPGQGASIDIVAAFPGGITGVSYAQNITVNSTCRNPFSTPRLELTTGALAPGLSLQPVSGSQLYQIAGIPTRAGTYTFGLRAQDVCASVTREFSITITDAALQTPPMAADVAGVRLIWERGTATAPSEEAVLITTGTAPTSFTLSVASDGNWLSVAPTQGITPSVLAVRAVNFENLLPGVYNGTISINSSAPNSPFNIPVTLEIRSATTVTVAPASLVFNYELGGTVPASQSATVQGSATGLMVNPVASTSTGLGWLGASPAFIATPGVVTVSVNPLTLPVGTYTGVVNFLLQGSRQVASVPVTLNVHERGPVISSVVSGASFLPGPVAPGEIVTLYGVNMGPSNLVTYRLTPAGTIDTNLADVRVWFDEQLAPLLHVSAQQITVVAPYSIAGRSTVRMQVEYGTQRSAIREVPVAPSSPALFTIGGSSQGAILNQDATVNGTFNGAEPGSIVSLFATGEGMTAPNGVEGAIVPSTALARPLLPVSVTIAGRPAEVLYAGSAPGQPAGLMQVNVRIPADTPAGLPAPVVLTIGNASSQPGVTLFVRP